MHTAISPDTLRRSSRVPFTLPLLVTSMTPTVDFSEVCETLVVNAHGCAVRSPVKLEAGVAVFLHNMEGRKTTAHVVDCQPIGADEQSWRVGARLDEPENFWGIHPVPQDWTEVFFMPPSDESHAPRKSGRDLKTTHRSSPAGLKVVPSPSQVIEQVSEERLRALIAEVVRPLHAEVTNLREKMARPEAQRSQFEVSLSYIPPEVEEKIWLRLQQDLGAQALRHASEQTEQVLGNAKSTIDHKIASAEDTFRRQLTQELEGVEARARGLSEQIEQAINDRLHTSSEKLQQQASQAGSHLAMRSEEFFHSLQHRLTDEHATRLQEIEQVQTAIDAESSRQQDRVGDLSSRIARLDEVARRLETDFDNRLAQTSNDVISKTRTQLESNAALIMSQMETRNAARLEHQLDAACGRLKVAEQEIEASVADAMRVHTEETLRSFEQAMDELAGHAVGRWRRALARDLGSVARILGDEVRMEIGAEGSGRQ